MERRFPWQTMLLWVVAVVLINAIWLNVAGQTAPNEINAEENFNPTARRTSQLSLALHAAIPATFESTFKAHPLMKPTSA